MANTRMARGRQYREFAIDMKRVEDVESRKNEITLHAFRVVHVWSDVMYYFL